MKGSKKEKMNLIVNTNNKEYSGRAKNTLKSRIMSMDKGWIGKKKEIKNMNRSVNRFKSSVLPMSGLAHK